MNCDNKLWLGAMTMWSLSILVGFPLVEFGYPRQALIEQSVVTAVLAAIAVWRIAVNVRAPAKRAVSARAAALESLHQHGIEAHSYLPAAGCDNAELAQALLRLGDRATS